MLQLAQTALLWSAAIGCAVIGGVYFTFSTFAMSALSTLDRVAGMSAMQAINAVILRSPFMPLFFGTTLAGVALAGLAVYHWSQPVSLLVLAGAIIFVAGMFLVTVLFNVPMNNELMAADAASASSAALWQDYLTRWTLWNHVRTVSSIAASVIFALVLVRG